MSATKVISKSILIIYRTIRLVPSIYIPNSRLVVIPFPLAWCAVPSIAVRLSPCSTPAIHDWWRD